jgi:hypothetical protein
MTKLKQLANILTDAKVVASLVISILGAIIWGTLAWNNLTSNVVANEEDIQTIQDNQMKEIEAREELLQQVQDIQIDVSAIRESNKINLSLLQQILGYLKQ